MKSQKDKNKEYTLGTGKVNIPINAGHLQVF